MTGQPFTDLEFSKLCYRIPDAASTSIKLEKIIEVKTTFNSLCQFNLPRFREAESLASATWTTYGNNMQSIATIINNYRTLLNDVDNWFNRCLQAGGSNLACRGGCNACCRSLFDITLLDAWLLQDAFAQLSPATRNKVLPRCEDRLQQLQQRWPELQPPFLLNSIPDEEWMVTPEDDETPCPLLDDNGLCLVYASRPLTCRLHGLPNIDFSGEDFEGTVCTLHEGDPFSLPEDVLLWRFREMLIHEIKLFRVFTEQLTGTRHTELNTFIPLALLADYTVVNWATLGVRREGP